MTNAKSKYHPDNIKLLPAIEHVRRRIPKYFGDHRIVNEMVWGVIGEAVEYCQVDNNLNVILRDEAVEISHNGESYPANQHLHGKSVMQILFTQMVVPGGYRTPIAQSMRGVGVNPVNAASRRMVVQTKHQGYLWQQIYEAGYPITNVRQVSPLDSKYETGTTISFQPDFTIIKEREVDFYDLLWQLQFLAGFIPDIELTLHDQRSDTEIHDPLIVLPCDELEAPAVHEPLVLRIPLNDGKRGDMDVELQYHHTRQPSINAYFNGLPELQLRPYLLCLLDDLRKYVNKFLYKYSHAPQNALTLSDICAGLSLDLYKRAASDSQHNKWSGNDLHGKIHAYMDNLRIDNPTVFYRIIEKCLDNSRERVSQ